jgi:hypothetical protein
MQSAHHVAPPPLPPQEPTPDRTARGPSLSVPHIVPPPLPPQELRPATSIPVRVDDEERTEVVSPSLLAPPATGSASREDADASGTQLRATIDAALAPLQRSLAELLRRVDELERRPQAATGISVSPAPRGPARSYHSLDPTAPAESRMAARSHHSLDVAAIERDASIVVDAALNGRSRRRRLVLTFVFLLVVLFGALGYALALSYAPH